MSYTAAMRAPHLSHRTFAIAAAALFVVLGALLFWRVVTHDYIALDDDMVIFANTRVQALSIRNLAAAFTTFDPELYVPLTVISLQFSWVMGGGEPWAFHLGNILLHIGNAMLAAWLLALLLKNRWAGAIAGVVFLVHPLNVEAVAWASARKDVLSAFFALASCIAYVYGLRGWSAGKRVSIELFVVALLCKVSVIVLPAWLLVFDALHGRRMTVGMVKEKWMFFAVAALFAAIAVVGKPVGVTGLPLIAVIAVGAKATIFYVMKFFAPTGLSILYELGGPLTTLRPDLLLSMAACAGAGLWAWLARKHWPVVSAGIALFGSALVPTFFNAAKGNTVYFASDRYVYLAMLGLLLILGDIAMRFARSGRTARQGILLLACACIGILSVMTRSQAALWRDSVVLFEHALTVSPHSAVALNNLGNAYIAMGQPERAEALYRDALTRNPDWGTLRMNLANALEEEGHIDEATALLHAVIDDDDASAAEAWFRLGNLYAKQRKEAEAKAAYEASLRLDPSFVLSRFGEARVAQ